MTTTPALNLASLVVATALDAGLPYPSAQEVALFCVSGSPPTAYADRCSLNRALKKLRALLGSAWHQPNQRHTQVILAAQRNRPTTDDPRPADVRGVAPDWRAHPTVLHPTLISADDFPITSQAKTWALSLVTT